ncbi:hypothetical protein [Synechococcus sp. SYN20]|uniref:hypothetical protein n=1 Tax=Synechococcus sp. SYN20 TaxID=1050714 RepID=UPI001645F570|nr:hypothetical protein [Synechococcus sp. SYN20]
MLVFASNVVTARICNTGNSKPKVNMQHQAGLIEKRLVSRVRFLGGFHCHDHVTWLAMLVTSTNQPQMSTEVRNWDVVAKAMEAAGATSSEMYVRAKALALGKLDPMPTSSPEAPYSISAVAG